MAILNENLDWNQIVKIDRNAQSGFLGTPVKTLLSNNEMLCRFLTTVSDVNDPRGSNIFFSPWWSDWQSTWHMVSRWKTARVATKDVLRAKLAITHKFNERLDSLVQIVLTKPVYGWKGIAKYQSDARIKVTYLGGGTQLYVPNLASDKGGLSSNAAYLHSFNSIDSLG